MDSYDVSKNGMNQITYVVTLYELEGTTYRTRAIISRGLYIFLPHFQRPFIYCDLWLYVSHWLRLNYYTQRMRGHR